MTATVRLRDIGTTYGGLTGKSKADFGNGAASFVTFLEVINNTRLRGRALERVRVAQDERQCRVIRGDVLFNGSSETPEEVAMSAVVDFDPDASTYLNSFCFGYRLRPDVKVDPTYIAYFFRSPAGRSVVASLAQGATRYNIAKTKFLDLELALPSLKYQRESVDALNDVEDLIASIECSITKKQAIKQGMMQELLTGKTRLPGFNRPWSKVELGDLAEVVSGGTPSSSVQAYWDGGIPWATPTDITSEGGRYLNRTERTISKAGLEHSAARLLPAGSLLLCTRATVGEVKIALVPTATNQGFKSLLPNSGVSSAFLYYKVLTLKDALTSKGSGSTFLEVSKRDVTNLFLEAPDSIEQIAIATALTDADDEIDCLTVRLSKACNIKQGMMQELLTGRTRLPVQEAVA